MVAGAHPGTREEWRVGWTVVLAGAVGIGVTSLHFYSLGLFIDPLAKAFGWSRASIASGPAIVAVVNLFIAARIGRLVDRVGVRRVALPGYAAYCSGLALLGLAGPSVWSWYALWALLGVGYSFAGASLWSVAVASRFDRSRGLALAVALCGTGVAGASTLFLGARVLDRFGWQATYAALGGTVFLLGMPVLLAFLRSARDLHLNGASPDQVALAPMPPGMDFPRALRHPHFWMLSASAMLIGGGVAGLIVHFVPMGISRGIAPVDAAAIGGLIGMSAIVGRLITGSLMDHCPARLVGGCVFLLPVAACILLAPGGGAAPLMISAAIIIGLATGAEFDVLAILVSRYLGMRAYAAIYGQIAALFGIGVGFGPTIGGALFDMFGTYQPMLWFLAMLFAIAAILLFLLGPAPDWSDRRAPADQP